MRWILHRGDRDERPDNRRSTRTGPVPVRRSRPRGSGAWGDASAGCCGSSCCSVDSRAGSDSRTGTEMAVPGSADGFGEPLYGSRTGGDVPRPCSRRGGSASRMSWQKITSPRPTALRLAPMPAGALSRAEYLAGSTGRPKPGAQRSCRPESSIVQANSAPPHVLPGRAGQHCPRPS